MNSDIDTQLIDVSRLAILLWNQVDLRMSEYRVETAAAMASGIHKALEEHGESGGSRELHYDIIAEVANVAYDFLRAAEDTQGDSPHKRAYEITIARLCLNRVGGAA